MLYCGLVRRSFFGFSVDDDVVKDSDVGWNDLGILDATLLFALLTNVNAIIVSIRASRTISLYIFSFKCCNVA